MSRPKRNNYLGSWTVESAQPIDLPFTAGNLRCLMEAGAREIRLWTHQQIAFWAMEFANTHRDHAEPGSALAHAVDVAEEVDAQWDLHLSNTYTYNLEQLQCLDFSTESMPREWFEKWHAMLALPPA